MLMKLVPIKRKEAKSIAEAASKLGIEVELGGFKLAATLHGEQNEVLVIDRDPVLVMFQTGEVVPHVKAVGTRVRCHWVKVDDGAVPHVLRGADVMSPGITSSDEFGEGDSVAVLDQRGRVLSTGIARLSSDDIRRVNRGSAIRTMHTIDDAVYRLADSL